MRLRAPAVVVLLTAALYALWSWSVAGGHEVTAIVSGVALVPLFIVLAATAVRQAAVVLGRLARRRRPHPARSLGRGRSRRRATTMVSGGPRESAPGGAGSSPPSTKIAA